MDNLRKARIDMGYSQQEMADFLGISRVSYVGYAAPPKTNKEPGAIRALSFSLPYSSLAFWACLTI